MLWERKKQRKNTFPDLYVFCIMNLQKNLYLCKKGTASIKQHVPVLSMNNRVIANYSSFLLFLVESTSTLAKLPARIHKTFGKQRLVGFLKTRTDNNLKAHNIIEVNWVRDWTWAELNICRMSKSIMK